MTGPDPQSAFYLVLNESPGDIVTLLALSDWYDEAGDVTAAECIRWSARRKRWPFRYTRSAEALSVAGSDWHEGWFWWGHDDPGRGGDWGHPDECRLPIRLWRQIRHLHSYTPAVFKEYPTVRQAYEALIAAWPLVQLYDPARRRERRP